MQVIKPPSVVVMPKKVSIFLAGSIENGKAEPWQKEIEIALSDLDIIVMNPRRDDWNPKLRTSANNPKFVEQVDWELDNLEKCDLIAMYLAKKTLSPISLVEFGKYSTSNKMIVCCPTGFWKKGNVDIVCHREAIPTTHSKTEFILMIRERLKKLIVARQ